MIGRPRVLRGRHGGRVFVLTILLEISDLRGTAAGTVRAQLAHVYAKAGVTNRTQLVALSIEDLLAGPLATRGH